MLTAEQEETFAYMIGQLGIPFTKPQLVLAKPEHNVLAALAGPGSGKTTAMVAAVGAQELVARTPANRILCITFTDKGAREFATRHEKFMKLLGLVSTIKVSTINAMCKYYVEIYYDKLGMPKCSQMSEEDSIAKLLDIMEIVLKTDRSKISNRQVQNIANTISFLNNRLLFDYKDVAKTYQFISLKMSFDVFNKIRSLYRDYQRQSGNLDFDEMMLAFYDILKTSEAVRELVQSQLRAIYVDEFQDTSKVQLEIIMLIKAPSTSLTVIGDNDQSIYRWRGATDAFNILLERFPQAEVVKIDTNFRCPNKVITFANNLIRNSTNRIPFVPKGTGKKGRVNIFPIASNREATKIIADDIINSYEASGRDNYDLLDKMVLYRNHSQAMLLVYELALHNVPVVASKGTLLHNDKMIKDMEEIVQFLENPRDKSLAARCIHKLTRCLAAPKDNKPSPFADPNLDPSMHFAQVEVKVKDPDQYVKDLRLMVQASNMIRKGAPAREIFQILVPMYMDGYYSFVSRIMGKLEEDVKAIIEFLTVGIDPSYDMNQYRYLLSQAETYVSSSSGDSVGVRVISMHTCKGLEAKKVYILDANSNANPNRRVIEELVKAKAVDALEEFINEERSLFYVAITRALEELTVTYQVDNPSPFNLESGLNEKLYLAENVISIEKFFEKRVIDSLRTVKKSNIDLLQDLKHQSEKEVASAKVEVIDNTIIQPRLQFSKQVNSDASLKQVLEAYASNVSETIQENKKRREYGQGSTILDRHIG